MSRPSLRIGDTVVMVGQVGDSPRVGSIRMGDVGVVVSITNTPPEDYAYVRFPDTGVGGVPVDSLRVVRPTSE